MNKIYGSCFAFAIAITASSAAAEQCGSHLGQVIEPMSFKEAAAKLQPMSAAFAPKGEFETTEQYQTRIRELNNSGPSIIFLEKVPNHDQLQYDADSEVLNVLTFAFYNIIPNFFDMLWNNENIEVSTQDNNIGVAISRSDEEVIGTYEAENAYGQSVTVLDQIRDGEYVFERKEYNAELFAGGRRLGGDLDSIAMPISLAKRVKPELRVAFAITPKSPYFASGEYEARSPTISSPVRITEKFEVLIADISCAFLMDPSGKVIGAYETN